MSAVEGGAVILARRFFERWTWTLTGNQIKVFLFLLYRCRWKPGPEPWWDGQRFVEVTRGQCVISADGVAKACKVSRGCVRRTIEILRESDTATTNTVANRYTVLSFTNYETYQNLSNYGGQRSCTPLAGRKPGRSPVVANHRTQKESGIHGIKESGNQESSNPPPRDQSALVVVAWNQTAARCKVVRSLGRPAILESIRTRLKDPNWYGDFLAALPYVEQADFMNGGGDRGWRATLEWMVRKGNVEKYATREPEQPRSSTTKLPPGADDERLARARAMSRE